MANNSDDPTGCILGGIVLLSLFGAFIEWLGRVLGSAWTAIANFFSNLWISISGALPLIGQIIGVVVLGVFVLAILIRAFDTIVQYRKKWAHKRSLLGRIETEQENVRAVIEKIGRKIADLSKKINDGNTFVSHRSLSLRLGGLHARDSRFLERKRNKTRALIRSWTNVKNTLLLKKHHLKKTLNGLDERYAYAQYDSEHENAAEELDDLREFIEDINWLIKYDFAEWWDIDMDLEGNDLSYYEKLSLEDLRKAVMQDKAFKLADKKLDDDPLDLNAPNYNISLSDNISELDDYIQNIST